MNHKIIEENMSFSNGGDSPATGVSSVRSAHTAVKYPSIAPLLYIPNSSNQNNASTVKVYPASQVSAAQRSTSARVPVSNPTTNCATTIQQSVNRSLLTKPQNSLVSSNKSNQTIVVANSSGVIRSMPAAMVMSNTAPKKQIITFGNSVNNVGNQMSLLDTKNLKYIGAIIKNKKGVEAATETNQPEEQNVLLVSGSNSVPANQSPTYILPKTQKPVSQNLVYTQLPGTQGKRLQVLLTTEGSLHTKPTISIVQSGNFSVSSVASKQESIIVNKVQPSVTSTTVPIYTNKVTDIPNDGEGSVEHSTFSKLEIQSQEQGYQKVKTGKYVIPRATNNFKSAQNPVLVPVKWKKQEDSSGRLQATSLGQIVSSNPAGSVTSFQISNGQILTEKVSKPHMLSLLYDNYEVEVVNQESSHKRKSVDSLNDNEGRVEEADMTDSSEKLNSEINFENINKFEELTQKSDCAIIRHRRKQELAVKSDKAHVTSLPKSNNEDIKEKSEGDEKNLKSDGPDLSRLVKGKEEVNDEAKDGSYCKDIAEESSQQQDKESTCHDNSDAEKENKNVKKDYEGEKFDPIKCLEWANNIGSLPLSDLKFRLNEFGLIEIVEEDEDEGKVSSKSSVVSDVEKDKKNYKNSRNSEEILCCHSCGTYGMGCEFVSSRFCSIACSKAHEKEKALSAKKFWLKEEKKLKLKQQKSLLFQQRAKLEELGLHEAKMTIEEKIKMLRMERELMKTNAGDSDAESGSGASSITDKLKSSSKGSFSWAKYLTLLKAKSAPYTLFKDPFPPTKNNFKVGMKLEGIDPVHPSLFCVLTVMAVRGYRIKLHFDGYPDCHDFWVNANSGDIFHAGWCERTNHKLSAPKGYGEKTFNWGNYLRMTRTVAAPKSCFVNNQEKPIIPSGFRTGMKLEAVDKKNSSLVCVATISDVLDNRILVHFDSWDDIYDYWVDCTSPYIHPVGWCKENGHQLTPPNDYKDPSHFSWDVYLRETKSLPAPARAFKPRTTTDFRRGMKLECVDKRNPILIRVATVVDIVVQQIKIKFDGWPDQYAYWLDDDSPDIHPAGWCQKTGHPLEPPPSEEDIRNTSLCPTPGCRGIGHVKGKHPVHHMIVSCPYSSINYLRDDHIPDRFFSKREYYEVKETSASKGTKPRPGVPRKNKGEVTASPIIKQDNRGRKRKTEAPILLKKKTRSNTMLEENADLSLKNDTLLWANNRWDISETVASIGSNPLCWTPNQVAVFVENINNSSEKGKLFTEHQIDGEALLMLSQNDLVQILGFKLGPAIKLYKSIVMLREKALEIKNGVSS